MERLRADTVNFILRNKRPIKIVLLFVVCGMMVLKGLMQIPQINENKRQIAALNEQIEYEKSRQSEIDELSREVDSDEYIEKVASEKLGLVKSNAKIFIDISQQQN